MRWSELTAATGLEYFRSIAWKIRRGELDLGRQHYALMLAHGVQAAMSSGLGRVSVVELGVARGDGLLSLCKAAAFFRQDLDVDIRVYGFDTGSGLSDLGVDYRDHPELFHNGEFAMSDVGELRGKLPEFAELIIGDVGETIATFETTLRERPLAFASFDLDLYSSTKRALPLLKFDPSCYAPVVPLYFDDMECNLCFNEWAGPHLALNEFNAEPIPRRIGRKQYEWFQLKNFFVCHILDHPFRQGGKGQRRLSGHLFPF